MAAMTTALTEIAEEGYSVTYKLPGSTALKPKLVIHKRKIPTGNQVIAENTLSFFIATDDANSVTLAERHAFSCSFRTAINGASADVTTLLGYVADILASDEFVNSVNTSEKLQ